MNKDSEARMDHMLNHWVEDHSYLENLLKEYVESSGHQRTADELSKMADHLPILIAKLFKYIRASALYEGTIAGQRESIAALLESSAAFLKVVDSAKEKRIADLEKQLEEVYAERQQWLDSKDPNAGPYVPWSVYEEARKSDDKKS